MKKTRDAAMINIGPTYGAVMEARKAVMEILKMNRDSSVLIAALHAFTEVTGVKNVTVQNCTFKG